MVGIDIGSTYIKAVEVDIKGKDQVHIVRSSVVPVSKTILSESEMDIDELAHTLKTAVKESGMKMGLDTTASILESQVFTRVIETPALSDKELNQALQWEAERYIPLPLNEVAMDSTIIDKKENTMEVLIVASPLRLIEKYQQLFKKAGVRINALENEALSVLRMHKEPSVNSIVLDIGGDTTNLYVIHGENLALVRTISIGGKTLTKSLSTEHNLAINQAEEYKRTYGLQTNQMEGQVAKTLISLIEPLVTEVIGSMTFFKDRYPEEVISKIILIGGSALLPELSTFIGNRTQVQTEIGNPWKQYTVGTDAQSSQAQACMLSVATGLALRSTIS